MNEKAAQSGRKHFWLVRAAAKQQKLIVANFS